MGGIEFFLRALPLLEPRVYYLGRVERAPVVIYSDAEWSPPPNPPLAFDKGLGDASSSMKSEKDVRWKLQSTYVTPWLPGKHR